MEKYGFVYLWFDKKRKMFYIGSHWGTEDDGYICGSTRMRNAYKRRPDDFKRRILKIVDTTHADLYNEETRWLSMIKPNEAGTKYYNLYLNGWGCHKGYKQTPIHRIKNAHCVRSYIARHGNNMLGRKHREDSKDKMRGPKSLEQRIKMRMSALKRWERDRRNKPQWQIPATDKKIPIAPALDMNYDYLLDSEGTLWFTED